MDKKPENTVKVPKIDTTPRIKAVDTKQTSANDTSNWDNKVLTAPNGRIVGDGSHNELILNCDSYKLMYKNEFE